MMWRRRRTGSNTPVIVPNLVLAQRVIKKMAIAASHFIEDETGEAMVGLLEPGINTGGVPTIYVLDTISPDETAVRQLHTFQQGDHRQDELIWWLQENWRSKREKRTATFGSSLQSKWDIPLRYLGDWHKQPGFMIAPSGGDRMTALDWLDDESNEMDFLLVPIVTLGHPATTFSGEGVSNYLSYIQEDGTSMRVDFWFIHREMRHFQPITPAVYPDDQLPGVAAYPWHLTHEDRADEELQLLERDGLFVSSAILWDADDTLPLEICFIVARKGASDALLLVTPRNFPADPPKVYRAPLKLMNAEEDIFLIFETLWAQAKPVPDPAGWKWTAEKRLIQYIHAVEDEIGIVRPAKVLIQSEKRPAEAMPAVNTPVVDPLTPADPTEIMPKPDYPAPDDDKDDDEE